MGSAALPAAVPLLLALVPLAVLAAYALRSARRAYLRGAFRRTCGIDLPRDMKVARRRGPRDGAPGTYSLAFPVWRHAARDGTADRRRSDNQLVWGTCALVIGGFVVTCRSPLAMHAVVSGLRARGAEVSLCDLELARYRRLLEQARELGEADSAQALYRAFSNRPRGFEEFCARLWSARGYQVRLTPPTNDGGYDLVVRRDGEDRVVECKCYAPDNGVGRPLLQKLAGANEVAGARGMTFVTTSSFTAEALGYARRLGIECVDGRRLMGMWEQVGGPRAVRTTRVVPSDAWLGEQDVEALYPADCRGLDRKG